MFEIVKTGGSYAGTPTTLVSFNGTDGAHPTAGLTADAAGDLFGTTSQGGTHGNGTVFELVNNGGGSYTLTTLVSFNGTNGGYPEADLIIDATGNLFGTTLIGGTNGIVFEIPYVNGNYSSTPTTLVSLSGNVDEYPEAGLIADAAEDLFGTTQDSEGTGQGKVFKIAKSGGGYASTPTIIANISGDANLNGGALISGLIADSAGDLFGTTQFGGTSGDGIAFEIPFISGSYSSTPTILFNFDSVGGYGYGYYPNSTLIIDGAGNLYGTTLAGGDPNYDGGTVFRIDKISGGYASTPEVLFLGGNRGYDPIGAIVPVTRLMIDAAGNIFGTTSGGGTYNSGTVFEITGVATPNPALSVSETGVGSGIVTSSPTGINCGEGNTACSASFATGTQVTLTASAASGSVFSGWSGGGCSGTGTCQVTLNSATSVTATFTQLYALGVSVSGNGVVTSSPTGISCGSTCSANFAAGTPVTLTASPNVGWSLSGWGGACSGTGSCSVTMTGAKSVSATFTKWVGTAANIWGYTCNGTSFDNLAGVLAGTVAWTSTTSSAATSAGNKGRPVAGDIVEITNICLGDVVIATGGLTITNHNATYPSSSAPPSSTSGFSDGIDGEVEVDGACGVTLSNLILEGPVSGFASGTSNFTGNEFANLYVHDGASVTLQNDWIGPGPLNGVLAQRAASVWLQNSTVSGNGVLGHANYANGIWADAGASITLGNANGGQDAMVHDNGTSGATCQGDEVLLSNNSSADVFGSWINNAGSNSCSAIYGTAKSSARLQGTAMSYAGAAPAIQFVGSSSVWIQTNTATEVGPSISGGNGGALLVAGGSSAVLQGSTFSSASSSQPTIEATASSSLIVVGSNTITNSIATGVAIQIDHSSSMQPYYHGTNPTIPTVISGAGVVQEQSSMDLGSGLVSGSPSISWTTGSAGISVQQNSSFRVSGGVSITGAVTITQGSNGFANTANGGTNSITSASWPFTTVPVSHWASPTKVTPAVPSATSYASATSPQCLAF